MTRRVNERFYKYEVQQQPDDSRKHDALYQANQRIQQLEKLNATLAAEVDRMRPLVEAVLPWRYTLHLHRLDTIVEALDNYNITQPK